MKKDPSFSRVYEKFAELKIFLDVNLEPHLEERIDIVTKLTMLLSYWRATKGSQATLTVLVTQLEKVGMVSMAGENKILFILLRYLHYTLSFVINQYQQVPRGTLIKTLLSCHLYVLIK